MKNFFRKLVTTKKKDENEEETPEIKKSQD